MSKRQLLGKETSGPEVSLCYSPLRLETPSSQSKKDGRLLRGQRDASLSAQTAPQSVGRCFVLCL
jgi:hypothetical protein